MVSVSSSRSCELVCADPHQGCGLVCDLCLFFAGVVGLYVVCVYSARG